MPENIVESYSLFSNVSRLEVGWLWYPYIPCGKITILQGDPGGGKSTMIMDIIGKLTTGRQLPDGRILAPMNVLYQCSEDGLADTIKPRLEKAGADCKRVGYINEDMFGLTLDDEKIRKAIIDIDARLLVIDPFQAYIGDSDLSSATGMRKLLRRLSMWASSYNCAIVLVGHLNKRAGSNELYRGLGSIDLVAAARSVIQVDSNEDDGNIRILKHIKSSLAPKGADIPFAIDPFGRINWQANGMEIDNSNPIPENMNPIEDNGKKSKQEIAVDIIRKILANGPVEASVVEKQLIEAGVSERTMKIAKKTISVISTKSGAKWYWRLPTENGKYPIINENKENN